MAIDERNTPAGVADPGSDGDAPAARVPNLDELRLRLDTPLFARETGSIPAVTVPNLRELTWEHVINPTTSQPVVPPAADPARPAPIRVEDLLARPEPALAPLPERPDAPAAAAPEPAVRPTGSLPTFAAMLSGEVTTVSGWSGDALGTEGLVKPIDEPPPVARDADPVVDGLAALILQATPGDGTPVVPGGAMASSPHVESVAPPSPPVAVATPVTGINRATSTMSPPLVRDTGVHTAVPNSPVEAELNRLAYVPDSVDDPAGPVEVPAIAYSDIRAAEPAAPALSTAGSVGAPVLSQHEMFMPRHVTQAHRLGSIDLRAVVPAPPERRRKRHVGRRIVTTLVLLGMVAGGLFAVKHYVLDRVNWPKDVAPLASAVETERGLHFRSDVPIVEVDVTDYADKLAASLGHLGPESVADVAVVWRSLGIATGQVQARKVGLAAAVSEPAFYDVTTKQIFVAKGVQPATRTFALHRALATALLDQQFKWSTGLSSESAPAVVLGTRALFDADALAIAQKLLTQPDRTQLASERADFVSSNGIDLAVAQFGADTVGSMGLPLWPYLAGLDAAQRDAIEKNGFMTDDHALDLRRLTTGATDTVGSTTQGMLFWYYALASRLDDDLAWKTALGWRGDDVSTTTGASGAAGCVTATVTFDPAVMPVAGLTFAAWANAAPKESATKVTPGPKDNTLTVSACDPGAAVATNDGQAVVPFGGAPLRVQQFADLLKAQSVSPALAACAVYGDDPITAQDVRGIADSSGVWAAPAQHPAPDLGAARCSSLATTP